MQVGVKPADSDQVVNGFAGNWPADLGERPALWIPASSVSAARLEAAAGAETISDSRSLVSSPVLLAVRPQLKDALAQQNWATLPGLQTNPTALDELDLPGWGSLRLALPRQRRQRRHLPGSRGRGRGVRTGRRSGQRRHGRGEHADGRPAQACRQQCRHRDGRTAGCHRPATAPVHAVVTTEQQLFQRAASLPDAKNTAASWLPPGPTAIADYPTVLLSGDWLSEEQVTAASEFARFMRKPEQLAELAKAGFRTDGGTPPHSDVTSFAPVSAPLSVGDNAMRATLANALTTPAESPAVTIMLDQSMPTDEGGKHAAGQCGRRTECHGCRRCRRPPRWVCGPSTVSRAGPRCPTGPLADAVDGQPRSAALTATLDAQSSTSGGGAVSFTTLRLVYNDALANFRAGPERIRSW